MYGANATGKSTIHDALEYALTGRISEAEAKGLDQEEYSECAFGMPNGAVPSVKLFAIDGALITPDPKLYSNCFVEKNRIDDFSRISAGKPLEVKTRVASLFGDESIQDFLAATSFTPSQKRKDDVAKIEAKKPLIAELSEQLLAAENRCKGLEAAPVLPPVLIGGKAGSKVVLENSSVKTRPIGGGVIGFAIAALATVASMYFHLWIPGTLCALAAMACAVFIFLTPRADPRIVAQEPTPVHAVPPPVPVDRATLLVEARRQIDELRGRLKNAQITSDEIALQKRLKRADKAILEYVALAQRRIQAGMAESISQIKTHAIAYFNKIGAHAGQPWLELRDIDFPGIDGEGRLLVTLPCSTQVDVLHYMSEGCLRALGLALLLARAKVQKAPFVILDDVINALDQDRRKGVLDVLENLGGQIVILSHDQVFVESLPGTFPAKGILSYSIARMGRDVLHLSGGGITDLERAKHALDKDDRLDCLARSRHAYEAACWRCVKKLRKAHSLECPLLRPIDDQNKVSPKALADALRTTLTKHSALIPWSKHAIDIMNTFDTNPLAWGAVTAASHFQKGGAQPDLDLVKGVYASVETLANLDFK